MTPISDLATMLTGKVLPKDFLKNPQRVLGLALFIEELKTAFFQFIEKCLDEEIEKREMTITECSDLMEKFHNTSRDFDVKIIKYMIAISKTSFDIVRTMTVAFHYRNSKQHAVIIAEELKEKELPHHVWLEILNQKETWYFRISGQIERVVLVKTFETSPNSATIIGICNSYLQKNCSTTDMMLMSLSESNLRNGIWNELSEYFSINSGNDLPYPFVVSQYPVEKLKDVRKRFSEIKRIADEKIARLRETENHQLEIE
jgi:hypothetical protein